MSVAIGDEGVPYIYPIIPIITQKHFFQMTRKTIRPNTQNQDEGILIGKDEMNLAEFPLTRLGTRDQRDILVYEGWIIDDKKRPCKQAWTVRGATGLGLPNEFGDRVMLALIYLTFQQGLPKPKVEFSRYQLLKLVGMQTIGSKDYQLLEKTLLQIAGMTVESEHAFYDKAADRHLSTKKAFHILDNLWLKKQSQGDYDPQGEETSHANGFVVWGREFWSNMQSGYIKSLDLSFYYALATPLARRLYRLLDKRMHHSKTLEIDIFDLAARLGQSRYKKPSEVLRKLAPSLEELVSKRFLVSYEMIKKGEYSRLRFVRTDDKVFAKEHQEHRAKQAEVATLQSKYQTPQEQVLMWKQVKKTLKSKLSSAQYAIVGESELLSLDSNLALICVSHAFAVTWFKTHPEIGLDIQSAISEHVGYQPVQLEFIDRRSAQTVGLNVSLA